MKEITIYTDGACSGNPGPGGWGAVLIYNSHRKEISSGEKSTTNNRMELTALIKALEIVPKLTKEILEEIEKIMGNAPKGEIDYFNNFTQLPIRRDAQK